MTGLYFYKLISPYKEDVTKDCKLTINELDSNFLALKDMDIKDVEFDEATSVISLIRNNGEKLDADLSVLSDGVTKDLTIDYDSVKGEINIHYNGMSTTIDKLVTLDNLADDALTEVVSDATLIGLGSANKPLGISPAYQTGSFEPALKLVNTLEGEKLPSCKDLKKGDRYVTKETLDEYGLLYNYCGVKAMAKDLKNGWRIPSKGDWDNMLNAIEPCEYRNHDGEQSNKVYGKFAGKLLKSVTLWKQAQNDDDTYSSCNVSCDKDDEGRVKPHPKKIDPSGIDAYGMRLVPSGYHDDEIVDAYFHNRGYYWTSTEISETDIYLKRFDYNRSGVIQSLVSPSEYYSVRFVKDYDGTNFNEVECINGQNYPCVLVPSLNTPHGYSIWTVANADFGDEKYHPKKPNNGEIEEETTIEVFYINEWDGFKWNRKQLFNGEQIVLIEGLEGDEYIEYMVVDGELVSSTTILEEKVLEKVEEELEKIDEKIENVEERVEDVEEDLGHGTIYEYEYERDEEGNIIYDEDGNPIIKRDEEGNPIIAVDPETGEPIIKEVASGLHKDVEDNTKAIADESVRAQAAEEALAEEISGLTEVVDILSGQVETLEGDVDTIEKSVGLTEDGEFIPNSANTYTSGASTVIDAIDKLDKALDEHEQEYENLKKEVDDFEDAVGVNEDGSFKPLDEPNYVGEATTIQGEIEALDKALKSEEEARIAKDNYLEGRLIKTEQSDNAYDCANGVLTLETEDPNNTITIKLSSDFGIIPFKEYN